jgi:di/tricarboxylate transporter
MTRQAQNQIGWGILFMAGGVVLLSDPKCKCGCRTLAGHLLKVGFSLITGWAT